MRLRGRRSVVLSVRSGRSATADAGPTGRRGRRRCGRQRPDAAAAARGRCHADTVPRPVRGRQAVQDRPAGRHHRAPAARHGAAALLQPVLPATRPEDAQHAAAAQLHTADQRGCDARTPRGRCVQAVRGRIIPGSRSGGGRGHGAIARRPPQLFRRVGRQEDGRFFRHGGRVRPRRQQQRRRRRQRQ